MGISSSLFSIILAECIQLLLLGENLRFKEFQRWRRPEKRAKFADGPIPSFPWSYVAPLVGPLVGPSVGPLVGNNVENVNRHIPNTFIHIDTKLMRVMATIFQQCLPLAALSASARSTSSAMNGKVATFNDAKRSLTLKTTRIAF